jgi:hypothetical protein
MKRIALALCLLALASVVFAQTTSTKYFVAHQGGYIGEATVTVDKAGKVLSASIAEWQGPGGWAENNAPDGKSIVDGAVVRVPDPTSNTANADPEIKGYAFYIYSKKDGAVAAWILFTPGKDAFARGSKLFDALLAHPVRAEAYVKAAKADTLVNVEINGLTVKLGKKASESVHYGMMNKADKNATYMPLTATSIGYRYNAKAAVDFFKANPTADFASATVKKAKITLAEDKGIDANAKVSDYTAATGNVYTVADAITGATYSDYVHYSLELQAAYKMALAEQAVSFKK